MPLWDVSFTNIFSQSVACLHFFGVFWGEKAFKILMKSNLWTFSFIIYAFGVLPKKSLPSSRSQGFTPTISSKRFTVLVLTFISMADFGVNFCITVWAKGTDSSFYAWTSSGPRTICWRGCSFPPLSCLGTFTTVSLTMSVEAYFWTGEIRAEFPYGFDTLCLTFLCHPQRTILDVSILPLTQHIKISKEMGLYSGLQCKPSGTTLQNPVAVLVAWQSTDLSVRWQRGGSGLEGSGSKFSSQVPLSQGKLRLCAFTTRLLTFFWAVNSVHHQCLGLGAFTHFFTIVRCCSVSGIHL